MLTPHERRIPGGGHRDVLREDRCRRQVSHAVHRIDAVDDRNLEPRARGGALNGVDGPGPLRRRHRHVPHVQQRADVMAQDDLVQLRRVEQHRRVGGAVPAPHRLNGELRHLADLFFQRHAPEQRFDARIGALRHCGRRVEQDERGQSQNTHRGPRVGGCFSYVIPQERATQMSSRRSERHKCHPAGASVASECRDLLSRHYS